MMRRAVTLLLVLGVALHAAAQDNGDDRANGGEAAVAFGQRVPSPTALSDAQLLATLLSSQRYIVTPGDRYRLTVALEQTARFDLTVQDDGVLQVPYVGTMETTGQEYSALRASILQSLRRIPADYIEFELVAPARFEVFVGGAVRTPGTMIVHAMNRVQDAMRLAGGVDDHGSVRRIELVRADGSSQRIDLARFFEIGGDDFNPLLRPSDRVYVPVAETTVTIAGGVRYPGSYELLPSEGVTELVAWAGGLLPDADPDNIEISGYGESGSFGRRTVAFHAADRIPLRHQDAIIVRTTNRHTDPVVLSGAFYGRPQDGTSPITIPKKPVEATIPYSTGLSLRQAMAALGGPTPYAAAGAAFIIRADAGRVSFDAGAIWEGSRPDIPLRVNDRVVVPIDRVTVSVTGAVELPGEYELLRGATVADLVNQAGGPTPYANRRRMMVRQPDISGDYVSMPVTFEEGMLVMLRDNAVVRVLSSYGSGSAIVVEGAVYGKPIDGEGPITLPTALPAAASELSAGLPAPVPVRLVLPFFPGMTAYDALYAVGGPTPFARAEDSYVVRSGERIELDAAALWDGNTLTGDIPLQPRDQLVVPATEVFVTVLGEVNRPGVVPFQFGLTVSDYLLRSGGITREADAGLIHFVDKTGRSLRAAKLDAPVRSGDILIVERQVILRLLEAIQRIAPIVSLFNNTATAINTVSDWIDPSE